MSFSTACAQVDATIRRARSLFSSGAEPSTAGVAAASLRSAAQGTLGARSRMGELSGVLVEEHGAFVNRSASALVTSADADGALGSSLQKAASVTQRGAGQLDTVLAETRETIAAAAGARSPAAQRAVLAALKSQVMRAQTLVETTQQTATQLASEIRGLRYGPLPVSGPDDHIVDTDDDEDRRVQLVDNNVETPPAPPQPGQPVDPANPFVGDPRFGHWEDVPPPPPYVGSSPPPLKPEMRPFPEDTPLKVGPTTGMYSPGKTWIGDIDPPAVQGREGYRFRMAGQEATTITRMVNNDGVWQQQRWVQNVYEYQRNTSFVFGGDVGLRGIDGRTGDLGGLPPIQNIDHEWKPISLPQIAVLSAKNPEITYYLPDGCGGSVTFDGGVSVNPAMPKPIPVMTRPR